MKSGTILFLTLLFFFGPLSIGQERRDTRRERREPPPPAERRAERERPQREDDAARDARRPMREQDRAPVEEPAFRAPEPVRVPAESRNQPADGYRVLFDRVHSGFLRSDITAVTQMMGSQVHLNLRGGESGLYSASQAYYVLENYFRSRRLVSLDFTTIGESDLNPYATGSAVFNVKGSRDLAQMYVSLSWSGERWVITQINIY